MINGITPQITPQLIEIKNILRYGTSLSLFKEYKSEIIPEGISHIRTEKERN
jgi:hypothetical protein